MWGRRQAVAVLFVALIGSFAVLIPVEVEAQEDLSPVGFDGHKFDLPRSFADGFTAFVIDQPTEALQGDNPQPPRTEFRLLPYTDEGANSAAVGLVSVYTASDLAGYAAYKQYVRLHDLLSARPDLTAEEPLPTLYPYQQSVLPPDRYSEFFVNATYLDSEGYQGITFIYGRVIHISEDRAPVMFYRVYFEGISLDEQRYLSAQVEGMPELLESLQSITDYDEYMFQARALFHQPSDEAVVAWLNQSNLLFTSFDYVAQP